MKTSLKLMITTVLPALLFFLFPYSGKAQSIFYSKQEKYNYQSGDYAIVGKSGNLLYTYQANTDGYYLNGYNDSLNLMVKVALDFFPAQTEGGVYFVNYPDHILVFYQAVQRNYLIQYAGLLDSKGLLTRRPIAIDSVKTSWMGKSKSGLFKIAASPDKSKIVVYGLDKKQLHLTLLDNQLTRIYRKLRSAPTSDDIDQAFTDNTGRFYFTTISEAGRRNYTSEFTLFCMSADGKSFTRKPLPMQGLYLSGIHCKIDRSNDLIYIAGFYSEAKNGEIDGVFYTNFNQDSAAYLNTKNIPLGDSVRSDAQSKNKKKAFRNERVRELIIKNDGGFVLIAEDAYITNRTLMAPGWGYYSWYYSPYYADRSVIEYHYEDILALDFNADGALNWHKFIRKDQYSQDDDGAFSSYAFLNSGGSLVFLFNNFNSNQNQLDVVVLNANGSSQGQVLSPGNIGNADWVPRKAVQIANKSWLIPVLNRNNLFYAKMDF